MKLCDSGIYLVKKKCLNKYQAIFLDKLFKRMHESQFSFISHLLTMSMLASKIKEFNNIFLLNLDMKTIHANIFITYFWVILGFGCILVIELGQNATRKKKIRHIREKSLPSSLDGRNFLELNQSLLTPEKIFSPKQQKWPLFNVEKRFFAIVRSFYQS